MDGPVEQTPYVYLTVSEGNIWHITPQSWLFWKPSAVAFPSLSPFRVVFAVQTSDSNGRAFSVTQNKDTRCVGMTLSDLKYYSSCLAVLASEVSKKLYNFCTIGLYWIWLSIWAAEWYLVSLCAKHFQKIYTSALLSCYNRMKLCWNFSGRLNKCTNKPVPVYHISHLQVSCHGNSFKILLYHGRCIHTSPCIASFHQTLVCLSRKFSVFGEVWTRHQTLMQTKTSTPLNLVRLKT